MNTQQIWKYYQVCVNCAVGIPTEQSEAKKQIDKMPIIYDITKDLRFKEGKREGELAKARITVIRMLADKSLTVEKIASFAAVSIDFVKKIQKELEKNPKLT